MLGWKLRGLCHALVPLSIWKAGALLEMVLSTSPERVPAFCWGRMGSEL